MTNPTHRTHVAVRATVATALLAMVGVAAACNQDKLLTAPNTSTPPIS